MNVATITDAGSRAADRVVRKATDLYDRRDEAEEAARELAELMGTKVNDASSALVAKVTAPQRRRRRRRRIGFTLGVIVALVVGAEVYRRWRESQEPGSSAEPSGNPSLSTAEFRQTS